MLLYLMILCDDDDDDDEVDVIDNDLEENVNALPKKKMVVERRHISNGSSSFSDGIIGVTSGYGRNIQLLEDRYFIML